METQQITVEDVESMETPDELGVVLDKIDNKRMPDDTKVMALVTDLRTGLSNIAQLSSRGADVTLNTIKGRIIELLDNPESALSNRTETLAA